MQLDCYKTDVFIQGQSLIIYSYNPRQKSWHNLQYLPGNLSVRPLPPSSMLFIAMKLSLLIYNIVGGKGVAFLVMSLGIVPQIPSQCVSVPSDPGVPRTFVMDCSNLFTFCAVTAMQECFLIAKREWGPLFCFQSGHYLTCSVVSHLLEGLSLRAAGLPYLRAIAFI